MDNGGFKRWRYVPAFDGMRAIAVGLVVVSHTYAMLLALGAVYFRPIWDPLPGGDFGVDIFFALSGFLITALLFTEFQRSGRVDFRAFYIRRALRLLPALFAVLVATSIGAALTGDNANYQLQSLVGALFYFANWMPIVGFPVTPYLLHTWSLSVEEQFYIVWPAVVAWWWLRRGRSLVWLVCGYLCVSFAWRHHVLSSGRPDLLLYVNTLARADPLVIGALGAYLWATRSTPRRVGWLAWPGVAVIVWLVGHHGDVRMMELVGWTAMGAATTMVMVAIVNGWRGAKLLAWTPLRAIGRVSYGIYLWHVPVFVFVQLHGSAWAPATRILVAYSVTAALVVFSWFCIERPFLALKPRPRTKVEHSAEVAVATAPAAR